MIGNISPGSVIIDGKEYTEDLLIVPPSRVDVKEGDESKIIARIISPWKRKEENQITLADLSEVIPAWPEALILGTGFSDKVKVAHEVKAVLQSRGIDVISFPSDKAWEPYNELAASTKTAFALILT